RASDIEVLQVRVPDQRFQPRLRDLSAPEAKCPEVSHAAQVFKAGIGDRVVRQVQRSQLSQRSQVREPFFGHRSLIKAQPFQPRQRTQPQEVFLGDFLALLERQSVKPRAFRQRRQDVRGGYFPHFQGRQTGKVRQ